MKNKSDNFLQDKTAFSLLAAAIYVVLYRAAQSQGIWTWADLLGSVGAGFVLMLGVWALLRLLVKEKPLFAGFVWLVLVLYFMLGASFVEMFYAKLIHWTGTEAHIMDVFTGRIQLLSSLLILAGLLYLLYRLSVKHTKLLPQLQTLICWILLAQSAYFLFLNLRFVPHTPVPHSQVLAANASPIPADSLPDVYFLLFDELMNPAVLGADSLSAWEQNMRDKGFWCMDSVQSDYTETIFSVYSMMNIDTTIRHNFSDYNLKNTLNRSLVYQLFDKNGYEFHNYSIFPLLDQPVPTQQYDYFAGMNSFVDFLYLNTWTSKWRLYKQESERTDAHLYLMQELKRLTNASASRPRFVYAHFMLPHAPFGLDALGRQMPEAERKKHNIQELYNLQYQYALRCITEITDNLPRNPQRPFVLIITGDHGLRANYYGIPWIAPNQARQVMQLVYDSKQRYKPTYTHLAATFPTLIEACLYQP